MSSNRTTVFVDEWLCYDTILGEGAYGEVKLLINRVTEEKVACKIIDYKNDGNTKTAIQREVLIHRRLIHENVVRYLGRRQELNKEYIFLEYAPGGELFQLIEPDVGMSPRLVQDYMKQLLCGIKYIHSVGIAHRDIKPENILIGNNGVLKISDFGMATLFRHKGFERLLSKRCGTKPYLAPEVLKLIPYKAQPADIWSCGIVFVAMLTGELPWSEPTSDNPEFSKWCNQIYILASPWTKLGTASLSLAKQILTVEVEKRLTLEQIENHVWLRNNFSREGTSSTPCNKDHKAQRWHSVVEAETHNNRDLPDAVQSQPLPVSRPPSLDKYTTDANEIRREQVSFSQPTQNDNLMIQFTQSPITKDNFHNLVKRMTRFYVSTNNEETVTHLCKALDSYHCTWTIDGTGVITITMVDRMKNNVVFKANIFDMDGNILVDFRLSKGCGLEFKKKFLKIKDYLRDIIVKYN